MGTWSFERAAAQPASLLRGLACDEYRLPCADFPLPPTDLGVPHESTEEVSRYAQKDRFGGLRQVQAQ